MRKVIGGIFCFIFFFSISDSFSLGGGRKDGGSVCEKKVGRGGLGSDEIFHGAGWVFVGGGGWMNLGKEILSIAHRSGAIEEEREGGGMIDGGRHPPGFEGGASPGNNQTRMKTRKQMFIFFFVPKKDKKNPAPKKNQYLAGISQHAKTEKLSPGGGGGDLTRGFEQMA